MKNKADEFISEFKELIASEDTAEHVRSLLSACIDNKIL